MNITTNTHTGHNFGDVEGSIPERSRLPGGVGLSVWACAQRPARSQRGNRYVPETVRHPARMLPDVAAYAIAALTEPGDVVLDPLCGVGTTLVEALHLDRCAVGVDANLDWAEIARANLAHTHRAGLGGYAHVITGDARQLPGVLPPRYLEQLLGRVRLLLTAWPHTAHPHARPHARPSPYDLACQPPHRQRTGMAQILRGSLPLLAPDAHVVITARPWREHGELVDLPEQIAQAGAAAGLVTVQRCVALLAGVRHGEIITRASHFQRIMVARARADGIPWHLASHEDALVLRPAPASIRRAKRAANRAAARTARYSRPLALSAPNSPNSPNCPTPPERPDHTHQTASGGGVGA